MAPHGTEEAGIAETEDATVTRHFPIPTTVGRRRETDDGPVQGPASHGPGKRRITEVEDAAVPRHFPVAAAVRRRRDTHDRRVEQVATHGAVELGVPEREDPTVGCRHGVPAPRDGVRTRWRRDGRGIARPRREESGQDHGQPETRQDTQCGNGGETWRAPVVTDPAHNAVAHSIPLVARLCRAGTRPAADTARRVPIVLAGNNISSGSDSLLAQESSSRAWPALKEWTCTLDERSHRTAWLQPGGRAAPMQGVRCIEGGRRAASSALSAAAPGGQPGASTNVFARAIEAIQAALGLARRSNDTGSTLWRPNFGVNPRDHSKLSSRLQTK